MVDWLKIKTKADEEREIREAALKIQETKEILNESGDDQIINNDTILIMNSSNGEDKNLLT